ncbi:universal stress protein UspA-like protein [Desulfosporosinus orientis DSM 765]|uniref:Universal stress protein n=1 Tax=Desulfosporosinus orientis (strain ATCC 19365 / DSM 765 / NCIMB 8382 / VKM B-1628 / Singapore I) TaxID=768706 RepID=G7W7S9_DESOD|nr:universal stress protein [Desulfosporosinus orientis]AET66144.1 universal stress protein UspA-like protein [Desulfosporosinus orientis DSM 765]
MFKKILVATDASEYSRRALQTALNLAQKFQAEIVLLFVAYTPEAYWGYNSAYSIQITREEIEERGWLTLGAALEGIDIKNIPLKKKMIQGHPSSVILEEIANENIDLVVMGSHGYGPIAGAVLGSVSQRVLRKATCPVLIVK